MRNVTHSQIFIQGFTFPETLNYEFGCELSPASLARTRSGVANFLLDIFYLKTFVTSCRLRRECSSRSPVEPVEREVHSTGRGAIFISNEILITNYIAPHSCNYD